VPEGYLGQLYISLPFTTADRLGDGLQLDAIPTVGFSNPILSYISALRFTLHGIPMLKYGYEKVNSFVLVI
jgi:hypothetical protein